MTHKKNEAGTLLPIEVTQGVVVDVLPDDRHEFLLTTSDVARGYGVCVSTVRKHLQNNPDDLREGVHFLRGVKKLHTASAGATHTTMWTKRGVIRLGFFIKSDRARLFRDWAEELVIRRTGRYEVSHPSVALRPKNPSGRRINRLTPARVADILADVCMVRDDALRERLAAKIKGGVDYGC